MEKRYDEITDLFDKLNMEVRLSKHSAAYLYRELGVSKVGFTQMLTRHTLSLVNFIKLCWLIDLPPTYFFGDSDILENQPRVSVDTGGFVSKETALNNEIVHLRQQIRLLEELSNAYKKQLDIVSKSE